MSKRININDVKRESYIQLPRWLTTEEKYKSLSNDAKFAYAILKDRYRLSEQTTKNGSDAFIDENGDIYFVYTIKELMNILGLSDKTVTKIKRMLIDLRLLEEVRRGQGNANWYYLLEPTFDESENQPEKNESQTVEGVKTRKIYDSKFGPRPIQDSDEIRPIKKDFSELDLSNLEEEEYIVRAHEDYIAYEILKEELTLKEIDQNTINKIIGQLYEYGIEIFEMKNVEKQFTHMMDKQLAGKRIFDFAFYFAKGLKDLTLQSKATKQYQKEKLAEYAISQQNRPKVIFYDWLTEV